MQIDLSKILTRVAVAISYGDNRYTTSAFYTSGCKCDFLFGDARDVMVIVVGNGRGDMCSNPGRD